MKRPNASLGAAAAALPLGIWLACAGCLNPRPEELPSTIEPPRPTNGGAAEDTGNPGLSLNPEDGPASAPAPVPSGAPSGAEESLLDEPADAGAPDSGLRAPLTEIDAGTQPEVDAGAAPE